MQVSIIIPTLNHAKYLKNALTSVQNQSFPKDEYEVIVVDNNSTDETPEIVAELNTTGKKEVIYVKEPNIGLHNARHAGAKAAKGEILAYADDDVICDKNWLCELVKPYTDPEVGSVGGKILPKWEAEPPEWVKQYPSSLSLLDLGTETKELKRPGIYGCNFSIRRSLMFEVGGSNPDVFGDRKLIWYMGDGETGLLRKVLIAEKKIMYTPHAIVWHVIPESRLTVGYFKKRNFQEGISHSFFIHRTEEFSRITLFYRSCRFGIAAIVCEILALICKILKNNSYFKYEFIASSFKSSFIYEFKLIYDKRLRAHVKRRSWL
jgi:glycosyltransferase involved in cell wall biosynthesis